MSGCSRDALKEHLKLINEQLANKKSEYAESLSKLNVKLQQYLDDNGHLGPATATTTTTTTSNSTSATTSDTGADDGVSNAGGEETNDKSQSVTSKQTLNGGETEEKTKTPAADASKGLLELLSRARRMCWDESHLCKASLTDIQEWLSTLTKKLKANKDVGFHLQVLTELTQLRDCAGWKVKPGLVIHSHDEISTMLPSSAAAAANNGDCDDHDAAKTTLGRRLSIASVDSFFDTEEEHLYRLWKEVCLLLDNTLMSELDALLDAPSTVQTQFCNHMIQLYSIIATPELVWHRWVQVRQARIAQLSTAAAATTQQRMERIICTLDYLMKTIHLDLTVATLLATKPALDMLVSIHGADVMKELSAILQTLASEDGDTAANTQPNAANHSSTAATASPFVTTSQRQGNWDTGNFQTFCKLAGHIEGYVQQLHRLLEDHGQQLNRTDGSNGRDSRKPASPRPNLQRTLNQQFGRPANFMNAESSLIEEDEDVDNHVISMATGQEAELQESVGMTTAAGTAMGTSGIGGATLRHSRERWKWSAELVKHGDMLGQLLARSVKDSGHSWLSQEVEQLKKLSPDELSFSPDTALRPSADCLSASAIAFFSECESYLKLSTVQLENTFTVWKPKAAFTEHVDAAVVEVMKHVKEVMESSSKSSSARTLFYCWSLCVYCQHHVEEFFTSVSSKQSSLRNPFLSSRKWLEKTRAVISDALYAHELKRLSMSLHDDDSQDWNNQKAHFKDEKSSYPIKHFCLGVYSLLYHVTCCGKYCREGRQKLVFELLSQLLDQLASRYSCAKPTRRRLDLFRSDLIMLLSTVDDVLWKLLPTGDHQYSSSPSSTAPSPSSSPSPSAAAAAAAIEVAIHSIHQSCMTLYSTLVCVTSPIQTLVDAMKASCANGAAFPNHSTTTANEHDQSQAEVEKATAVDVDKPAASSVKWLLEFCSNSCHLATCIGTPMWSWRLLFANCTSSTAVSSERNMLLALRAGNYQLVRHLLPLVLRLSSLVCAQFDMFHGLVWPLHCVMLHAGKGLFLSALFRHDKDSVYQYLAQPRGEGDINQAPWWFQCVFRELDSRILRKVPAVLVDMTFKLSTDKLTIPRLPCGCPASPVQDLTPMRAAQVMIHEFINSARLSPLVSVLLHIILERPSKADPSSLFLAVIAQVITVKIAQTYSCCSNSKPHCLPTAEVRTQLTSAIWSVLGFSTVHVNWTAQELELNRQLCDNLVHLAKTSTSSSVCGVSIDATIAELHLRYHPDDAMKKLQTSLLTIKDSLPRSITMGCCSSLTEDDHVHFERMLASQSHPTEPCAEESCFNPLAVIADLEKSTTGSDSFAWQDHMKNVLENVTDTFLVELVKNRYEIWDQESTISSESKPSVHELRSILAATS